MFFLLCFVDFCFVGWFLLLTIVYQIAGRMYSVGNDTCGVKNDIAVTQDSKKNKLTLLKN